LDPWNAANAPQNSNLSVYITIYDSLGAAHLVVLYFRTDSMGKWEWHALSDGGGLTGGSPGAPSEIANGTLTFGPDGQLTDETGSSSFDPLGATNPQPLRPLIPISSTS
jgi:flagellar hook protein FlgE